MRGRAITLIYHVPPLASFARLLKDCFPGNSGMLLNRRLIALLRLFLFTCSRDGAE